MAVWLVCSLGLRVGSVQQLVDSCWHHLWAVFVIHNKEMWNVLNC